MCNYGLRTPYRVPSTELPVLISLLSSPTNLRSAARFSLLGTQVQFSRYSVLGTVVKERWAADEFCPPPPSSQPVPGTGYRVPSDCVPISGSGLSRACTFKHPPPVVIALGTRYSVLY